MPTNRNNNEVSQSFAIGTKIEYMNKLFEVTESNQCCDCSLATICSSSDIYANDRNDDVLSRDKRINIFGECSSLRRPDSKSVVFAEVPMNKSDNNTINSNIIQPLVEANGTVKALQIKAPTNFEIDVESSDLSKGIIRFKRKWLSLEQLYKSAKDNNYHTCFSEIKDSRGDKTCEVREKLIALSNLMDIARYFNGDWKFNAEDVSRGYAIAFYYNTTEFPQYNVIAIHSTCDIYYGNTVFKNEADAKYVIDNPNFREVLDKIFKV
jgi:hypothetical protein